MNRQHHNPQHKTRSHCIPIADLRRLAQGRWRAILQDAGIPSDYLEGRKGRPCPKCGGRDRFAPMRDLPERGAVLCRHCFNSSTDPRSGDGLASLQWWLGVDTAQAIQWLRAWLGIDDTRPLSRVIASMPTIATSKPIQSADDRKRCDLMARVFTRNLKDAGRDHLALLLGVAPDALRRLQVGWNPAQQVTSWPMRNDAGEIVGVRLRDPETGSKWSVRGSDGQGVFCDPDQVLKRPPGARVWIAEGPTDTAALLTLGFMAIGCPSSGVGGGFIASIGHRIRPAEWVIVADADPKGIEGAKRLQSDLVAVAPVRIITPPTGCKDARAWLGLGAKRETLEADADAADRFALEWTGGVA